MSSCSKTVRFAFSRIKYFQFCCEKKLPPSYLFCPRCGVWLGDNAKLRKYGYIEPGVRPWWLHIN